jgi:molybdopterin synthase catalytic subunit
MFEARIQREAFDPQRLAEPLAGAGVGALATFTGFCRDEGGSLAALELEHYPGMAETELRAVLDEAARRWPLLGARVVHRWGVIPAGDRIVFVAAAAAHRGPAFAAAEFMMDYLKTRAPFWKRELRKDGSRGDWVAARDEDDHAFDKWSAPDVSRAG